jgi:hypothetical protein
MPWKSVAQARWGHSAAGKKALGVAAIPEWDAATPKGSLSGTKGSKAAEHRGKEKPMGKFKAKSGGGMRIKPENRGKFTARAGGKKNIGSQIKKDLSPGSKASGNAKQEANFARMARRHWKPLSK